MNTIRHNYHLQINLKFNKGPIIAPRMFCIASSNYKNEFKTYFVHLPKNIEYVCVYCVWKSLGDNSYEVIPHNAYKLYSNTKGIYFNFSYWINNFEKKTIRVYICE